MTDSMSRLGGIDQMYGCSPATSQEMRADGLPVRPTSAEKGMGAQRPQRPGQHCDFGKEPSRGSNICLLPEADEGVPFGAVLKSIFLSLISAWVHKQRTGTMLLQRMYMT